MTGSGPATCSAHPPRVVTRRTSGRPRTAARHLHPPRRLSDDRVAVVVGRGPAHAAGGSGAPPPSPARSPSTRGRARRDAPRAGATPRPSERLEDLDPVRADPDGVDVGAQGPAQPEVVLVGRACGSAGTARTGTTRRARHDRGDVAVHHVHVRVQAETDVQREPAVGIVDTEEVQVVRSAGRSCPRGRTSWAAGGGASRRDRSASAARAGQPARLRMKYSLIVALRKRSRSRQAFTFARASPPRAGRARDRRRC